MTYDGHNRYRYDGENRLIEVKKGPQEPGPLAQACDTDLELTTGGDGEWFSQTTEYFFEGDAAQSGAIDQGEETWMQATVTGPGTIKFYWKISAGLNDTVSFYVDDVLKDDITYSEGWTQGSVGINGSVDQVHTLKWVYHQEGATGSGWVDKVEWQQAWWVGLPLDEAVDSFLTYTTGGDASWLGTTSEAYHNLDSAQSGDIGNSQETWMQTEVEGAGPVTFWGNKQGQPSN